jgi:hypothetical protein
VPGLLQTPEYSRDIFITGGAADGIDERVEERMRRQEILARPNPPQLWVLLDEGVIDRPTADPAVMTGSEPMHFLRATLGS